jgi:hypothetical protein
MTNGDKLRAMTDEQLGKALSDIWFYEWTGSHFCEGKAAGNCPDPWDSCIGCITRWLKKESD